MGPQRPAPPAPWSPRPTMTDDSAPPADAITLYGMSSPNVFKVSIMLEEAGLPYVVRHVNLFAQEQRRPAFVAISPNSRVPVIVDPHGPDGGAFSVFESGAALIYLAEKAGRLLPQTPGARSVALQWLMFQVASLGPMCGQYVHFSRHAPQGQDYGARRYGAEVLRLFDVIERRLEASAFLGGDLYSIADVASFPWVRIGPVVFPMFQPDDAGLLWTGRPALRRWFDAIAARPEVQRGIAALAPLAPLDQAAFAAADPAALDRFVGRA